MLVSMSDLKFEHKAPQGALWALLGAVLYAVYLVALRRKVDHEDKLDIPLFFGKLTFSSRFGDRADTSKNYKENIKMFQRVITFDPNMLQ